MSARSGLCSLTHTFFFASHGQFALGRMHASTWLALRPWLGAVTSDAIWRGSKGQNSKCEAFSGVRLR